MLAQGPIEGAGRGPGSIRSAGAIVALLTGLNLLNYLDRYVMAAVLPKVQDDLHLSNFVGGSLATVFLLGYFATSPVFGHMADGSGTGGRKRLMMLGVAVWSAATIATGFVRGVAALLLARACVGVGEASYATIAPTLIDDLTTPEKKGRALAIFFAAIPTGSALGYIVGGGVEHALGWRSAFFVAGVPGMALALLCLLVAEPTRRPAPKSALFAAARALAGVPVYRLATLGYCAHTAAIGAFAFWAPKYLVTRYGMPLGRASATFGLVTVVCGFVGTIVGGWLADAAVRARSIPSASPSIADDRATARANLTVCVLSAALGAPLAAAAILAPTPTVFFVLLVPCEIALFVSNSPVNVAMLRSAPPGLRASAMALGIFAIHLLGDLWSPPLVGLVADHAPWTLAMMAAPIGFGIAALVWQGGANAPSDRLT